ncbi:MAG: hypothetical protein H7A25_22345 [Leptospiraceae bacterium]|nr:hypothetical protein [Leptospiraceae bacterium]MCP5502655.1 hypothetical protein [Leptospiraceae bacterium]
MNKDVELGIQAALSRIEFKAEDSIANESEIKEMLLELNTKLEHLIANDIISEATRCHEGAKPGTIQSHKSSHFGPLEMSEIVKRLLFGLKGWINRLYSFHSVFEAGDGCFTFSNDSLRMRIDDVKDKALLSGLKKLFKGSSSLRFVGMINDKPCNIHINIAAKLPIKGKNKKERVA